MAYEKHTWECGETVTADKLNHMEDGIAEGGGGRSKRINISKDNVFAETITSNVASLIGEISRSVDCDIYGVFNLTIGENITQNEYNTLKSAAEYLATGDASFVIGDAVLAPIASGYTESHWYISVMMPQMEFVFPVSITYTINEKQLILHIVKNVCSSEE